MAPLGCLLNGRVDLGKPPVEVGNGVGLDTDLRLEVRGLKAGSSRPAVADMGGDKLCIDARRVDDGEAGDPP